MNQVSLRSFAVSILPSQKVPLATCPLLEIRFLMNYRLHLYTKLPAQGAETGYGLEDLLR